MSTISEHNVYAVPLNGKWLVVSGNNLSAALVNRAAVDTLAECAVDRQGTATEPVRNLWLQLLEPASASPQHGKEKLVVIPTRACNMRCVYCDFGTPNTCTTVLDPRLACRLIDDAVEKLLQGTQATLRIHFFGGEPLVARDCVETVVHYARMACARKGLVPWFEITTNGWFDPSVVPFIGDYMDSVVVSLDGSRVIHDFNRRRTDGGGTYSAIAENICRLSQFPIELSLRACITNRSVASMEAITAHFCSEFEFDILCFEMLAPTPTAQKAGLAPPDPFRFAAGVLKSEPVAMQHGVKVVHGPSELVGPRKTSCPVGSGTVMLDPEGLLTVCYLETSRWTSRGVDPILGRVEPTSGTNIEYGKIAEITRLLDSKPRCEKCFCHHTCAGGCHIEQTPPGCDLAYDDRCLAIRLVTAGRLLRNLEGAAAVTEFTEQPETMKSIVEHPDDRLIIPDRREP